MQEKEDRAVVVRGKAFYFESPAMHSPIARWLEREFTDRKVCGSNATSASRHPLSRLGQPGTNPALL
ncbi:hypothetical protein T265_07246 [Opisthorchis viverrini]|uniref:Uncharacterized protein n=1 Tax=Opisthorchis viverrini TaxID=6198 RepID=A0A074ZPL6_OPIVI|nr:hypothetical protein T265_07246 [Opisthorchis viverrini]KER25260.1 hypothetical protein T265_07246 [Opisthorchis viverrini]